MTPTTKHLLIDMSDGTTWAVPAHVIAHDCADHFARIDGGEPGTEEYRRAYEEEYQQVLSHQIEDWAVNQMDWEDVEYYAYRMAKDPVPVDYQEGWVNGNKRLVNAPPQRADRE